jgi:hypothetical protein
MQQGPITPEDFEELVLRLHEIEVSSFSPSTLSRANELREKTAGF